jgi:hypothetical protein
MNYLIALRKWESGFMLVIFSNKWLKPLERYEYEKI